MGEKFLLGVSCWEFHSGIIEGGLTRMPGNRDLRGFLKLTVISKSANLHHPRSISVQY